MSVSYTHLDVYKRQVPEIASRKHMELLPHVVEKALCDAGLTLDDICLLYTST